MIEIKFRVSSTFTVDFILHILLLCPDLFLMLVHVHIMYRHKI